MHRIQESMNILSKTNVLFQGEVEVEETYFGGKESNKNASKKLGLGRGVAGKKAVVDTCDRKTCLVKAELVDDTIIETLYTGLFRKTS